MDRSAFEADLKRDGYAEIVVVRFGPGHDPGGHDHAYDVRGLILDGEFIIAVDGQARRYRPGNVFTLASGCRHTERTGPHGVSFVAGRRPRARESK
jgi:quercetin dioxygenase-like cupin family protein